MNYLAGPTIITSSLIRERGRQERQSQRRRCSDEGRDYRGEKFEDAILLTLKMEKGAKTPTV